MILLDIMVMKTGGSMLNFPKNKEFKKQLIKIMDVKQVLFSINKL